MFRNDYQGGPYFEIFSVQGNQPLSKLKVSGPETAIRKKFDKELRTFILILEGESSTSKITLPKNSKQSLHLTQQYLVFQIFIFPGRPFSLEVSITDKSNLKQRIILSSSHREVIISSLHAKMPCAIIKSNVWLNLCLDLDALMKSVFDGCCMQLIDSTVVSANCKLKRIFTLKTNPLNKLEIPENMQLRGECTATQVIDMDSFVDAGINIRSDSATRKHPLHKTTSAANKDSHTTSTRLQHRYSGGPLPKLRSNESRNRYESLSSDEKESSDRGKNTGNDLSCCGTAIVIPKLPKLPKVKTTNNTKSRIIKSAECLKSKVNRDLIQNSQTMSKSADTRNRSISDISHASSYISKRLQDSPNLVRPKLRLQNIFSKSAIELQVINRVNKENLLFKSHSLLVLPSIKKQNEEFPSIDNPLLNLTSPDQDDDSSETSCLTLADDKMVDDYLQEQISNGEEESSSSCATSSGSDLFLYISRPHSVSHQMNIENQMTVNGSNSPNESADLCSNSEFMESFSDKYNALEISHENPPECIVHDKPNSLATNYSSITCNNIEKVDLEQNIDSDYSTEHCPEVSSSMEYSVDCNKDESYLEDSLDSKSFSTVKHNEVCNDLHQKSISENINLSNTDQTQENNSKSQTLIQEDTSNCVKTSFSVRESTESDTMSWLNTSVDQSLCFSDKRVANKTSKSVKYPPHMVLQKRIEEKLGSFINQSVEDVDDGFSDSSDDDMTTNDLPRKVKNYRYQDEINSISSTLDLSATISATPVEDQLSYRKDENNNDSGPCIKLCPSEKEELLDLLFDQVLNCYYDPKTQKYYELS